MARHRIRGMVPPKIPSPINSPSSVTGSLYSPKKSPRGFHRESEPTEVKPNLLECEELELKDFEEEEPMVEPSPEPLAEDFVESKVNTPPSSETGKGGLSYAMWPPTTPIHCALEEATPWEVPTNEAHLLCRPPERQSRGYRDRNVSPANLRPSAPSRGERHSHWRQVEADAFPAPPEKNSSTLREAAFHMSKNYSHDKLGASQKSASTRQKDSRTTELKFENINWSPRNMPRETVKGGKHAMECWVEKGMDTCPTASTASCTPIDTQLDSPGIPAYLGRGIPSERPQARRSPWNVRERGQRAGKIIVQCLEDCDTETLVTTPSCSNDRVPQINVNLTIKCEMVVPDKTRSPQKHKDEGTIQRSMIMSSPPGEEMASSSCQAKLPNLPSTPAQDEDNCIIERPFSPEPVMEKLHLKEVQLTPRSRKKNPGGRRIVIG